MQNILIIGSTRGLGLELSKIYASKPNHTVYGTSRKTSHPGEDDKEIKESGIRWVTEVDLMKPSVGEDLVKKLKGIEGGVLDTVIITAGFFATESFADGSLNWDDEIKMYTTSSIAPPFIVHALWDAKLLRKGSKVVLVSSESGSIALRHESEGGGNFGHHGSKAASNMVGRLLAMDLKEDGVIVSIIHPGFMKTEMTKGVGFDKFYESGGAVEPSEAADSLISWAESLTMEKSGEYWAVRGPGGIGTAEPVLGKGVGKDGEPLGLPW